MSDFLTRIVERALGRGPTVRPIVAPVFVASGQNLAGNRSVERRGETSKPGHAAISTGSRPLEEVVMTQRENPAHRPAAVTNENVTNEQETAIPAAQSELMATSNKQGAVKSAILVARPVQEEDISSTASEPRVTSVGKSAENTWFELVASAASGRSEINHAIVSTPIESNLTPRPHNSHDTFTVAAKFIQRRDQRLNNDLLVGAQTDSSGFAEKKSQAELHAVSDSNEPSAPQEVNCPKTRIHRDQPVSVFSGKYPSPPEPISKIPTIKVSIGRIEVRAIAPQSPVAKTSAIPTPKTSLDEYLKDQSGGKR